MANLKDLIQPVPAMQDNAHSAIDTKILENEVSSMVKEFQNLEMGTVSPAPQVIKTGLGGLENFEMGGAGGLMIAIKGVMG